MLLDNYKGRLLIAQPKCNSSFFQESVVLIVKHNSSGAWGVMLNKEIPDKDCCLADILNHVGMANLTNANAPLYIGGPLERSRVCILHTSDWKSSGTTVVTDDISVTTDISILAALSAGTGPSRYRAICGISSWAPGQLEGEMRGEEPWTDQHKWLDAPATANNVFDVNNEEQWHHAIGQAVYLEVKEWF
jgi:putative transcriptional regulator